MDIVKRQGMDDESLKITIFFLYSDFSLVFSTNHMIFFMSHLNDAAKSDFRIRVATLTIKNATRILIKK